MINQMEMETSMDEFLDLIEKEYGVEARPAAVCYYLNDEHYNSDAELDLLVSNFGDVFMGYYDSEEDFAYEYLRDIFANQIPEEMWAYIDYSKWIDDFQMNGGWMPSVEGYKIAVFNG